MKPKTNDSYRRLRSCLIADKGGALPRDVLDVLQHDLTELLSQYFVLRTLGADLDYDSDGKLWLTIDSMIERVKPFERAAEV